MHRNVTCFIQTLSSFACSPLNSSLQHQGGGIRWVLVSNGTIVCFLWHQRRFFLVGSRSSSNPGLSSWSGKRGWGWGSRSALLSLSPLLSWALPGLLHSGVRADCFFCWLPWGHLSRNSSYDPSVSPLCSAKGKAPADFASRGTNRVGFAWNDVLWYLCFSAVTICTVLFLVPTLEKYWCGYVSWKALPLGFRITLLWERNLDSCPFEMSECSVWALSWKENSRKLHREFWWREEY